MWYHNIPAARAFLLCWYAKKKKKNIPCSLTLSSEQPQAENNRVLKWFWPVHLNKTAFIILEQQNTLLLLEQQTTLCTVAKRSLRVPSDISTRDPSLTFPAFITGNTRATNVLLRVYYGNDGLIYTQWSQGKGNSTAPWVACVSCIAKAGSVSLCGS